MCYSHYFWRPRRLDRERWNDWVHDVRQIIRHLPQRVPVTYYPLSRPPVTVQAPLIVMGPAGDVQQPELNGSRVAFNGGGWVQVVKPPQPLSCETFSIRRVVPPWEEWDEPDERGWYFGSCKTLQLPYDLAVAASLIRLAHRFPEGVEVSSCGRQEEWQPASDLCSEVFGHAELPFADHAPAPAAEPDRLNELLAKRNDGLLAPHEIGELRELLDRDLEADQVHDPVDEPVRRADGPECEP